MTYIPIGLEYNLDAIYFLLSIIILLLAYKIIKTAKNKVVAMIGFALLAFIIAYNVYLFI